MLNDELTGTAWHEAGHAIILRAFGVRVTSVEVTTKDTGMTIFDVKGFRGIPEDRQISIVLAGMYAESSVRRNYDIATAMSILLGASSDRNLLAVNYKSWYYKQGIGIGLQAAHNRAEKLVQANEGNIKRVANSLLAKPNFLKILTERELDKAVTLTKE